MNIYEARRLQKILYKSSNADPRTGITFNEDLGRLCYYVGHRIGERNITYIPDEMLDSIAQRRRYGVKFAMAYTSPLFTPHIIQPDLKRYGMFLIEIIEIDE